ncbi:glycosyl transferase [Rhodovulum sulfidophilum]|uniref:Peptide O-xylosyltransferase n=1 Tax=Rhodovulum visakhapatnamense TaxID=364297 RepID=A0ABS1RJF5_9RHOB|nr:DUF5928 domain-containing protein [Rhodovulum visakhapatnamense]MBL3570547.1 glycosyl transferase [Rhodovulum visakhapatnamense]MBL3579787.1 glycosyl transferase [Rhodovulum visakhapatnamense]OLS43875.1 glycosyl transferase [Rhodovulum sulfidophilum]
MATVAYLLLCHRDPDTIVAQAGRLTAAGDLVAIHLDRRAPDADFAAIRAALAGNPSVVFARRVRCGWGDWSPVQATLNAARAALAAFPQATHLYLLSGDCLPIKPAVRLRADLDDSGSDHIESVDFFESGWIRTGLKDERLIYRHFFNERRQRRLFHASMAVQKALGLERAPPADLQVMIGSQWWCLRRSTVEAILAFLVRRPDVFRFFRTSWIPDETFFQTLVRHLVPSGQIRSRAPTFLMFTDYGMPVTFYNDHYDLLVAQEGYFARRISVEAVPLRARLAAVYASADPGPAASGGGPEIHRFLTGRGRIGQRFGGRAWERGAGLGQGRQLMLVTCKKWHVARRLVERVRQATGLASADFAFDDEAVDLPDLGGIERSRAKRSRHPRAFLRLVYESLGTDRLILCLDPADLEIMADFQADGATVRVLEIVCPFSQADLLGHARRLGLLSDASPPGVAARVLPALAQDLERETARLRAAGFPALYRLSPGQKLSEAALVLAQFLAIPYDTARGIADTATLFDD